MSSPSLSEPESAERAVRWDARLPATWALIAVIVAVHVVSGLVEWRQGYASLPTALLLERTTRFRVAVGGQFRPYVANGQVWRLWTSMLLHGDALHLFVNAVALGTLGRLVEPWVGAVRALSWFVLGALAGAALSQAVGILETDGASGGAFALLAAATVIAWRDRANVAEEDRQLLGPVLWAFLGINVVLSFALPFVNAAGHMGGLVAGAALGAAWRRPTRAGTVAHAVVVVVSAAICAWGFWRCLV